MKLGLVHKTTSSINTLENLVNYFTSNQSNQFNHQEEVVISFIYPDEISRTIDRTFLTDYELSTHNGTRGA